jgi:hypothetical protein
MRPGLREGLRYLLTAWTLLILSAVQMVVNLCLSVEKLIIYDARDAGAEPPLAGVVVAAGGAGGLAGAPAAAPLARWVGEMRLVLLAIAAAGASVASMCLASSAVALAAANLGYGAALVVASLVNRTQRQRLVPRDLLGRVTSTVRVLFLAADPLGVVAAAAATVALGGNPRPVFLVAGVTVVVAAASGWAGAAGCGRPPHPAKPGPGLTCGGLLRGGLTPGGLTWRRTVCHFPGRLQIGHSTAGPGVIGHHRLPVAGGLGDPDAPRPVRPAGSARRTW